MVLSSGIKRLLSPNIPEHAENESEAMLSHHHLNTKFSSEHSRLVFFKLFSVMETLVWGHTQAHTYRNNPDGLVLLTNTAVSSVLVGRTLFNISASVSLIFKLLSFFNFYFLGMVLDIDMLVCLSVRPDRDVSLTLLVKCHHNSWVHTCEIGHTH